MRLRLLQARKDLFTLRESLQGWRSLITPEKSGWQEEIFPEGIRHAVLDRHCLVREPARRGRC